MAPRDGAWVPPSRDRFDYRRGIVGEKKDTKGKETFLWRRIAESMRTRNAEAFRAIVR